MHLENTFQVKYIEVVSSESKKAVFLRVFLLLNEAKKVTCACIPRSYKKTFFFLKEISAVRSL